MNIGALSTLTLCENRNVMASSSLLHNWCNGKCCSGCGKYRLLSVKNTVEDHDCGEPILERSSKVNFVHNTTEYGSVVTVKCDDGDSHGNSLVLHCNEHGKWNITRSTCKGSLIAIFSLLVPALVSYLCCFSIALQDVHNYYVV
ncbi:hypothetical protein GQR58_018937 [Nymphon striatum]|nr:hypothetical protein GQR58_018937 [Nymphon striatum]